MLQGGRLTQLEWIDLSAVELQVDGVEFAASHFPRTDDDYLAQLKKLLADRGLTAAALVVDVAFGEGDVDRHAALLEKWLDAAVALGAPIVRFSCGAVVGSPGVAWRELIRGLKTACVTAKERNVTLALLARDGTLVASPADAKRALKECDSAWLQLAGMWKLSPEWVELVPEFVLVVTDESDFSAAAATLRAAGYIGFVSLEYAGSDDEEIAVPRAVASLRELM